MKTVLAVWLAIAAAPAAAETRVDHVHDVSYALNGRTLTVRLVPGPGGSLPDVRRKVWGRHITAICSPSFSPRRAPTGVVRSTLLWPRGEGAVTYTFSRDVSERAAWCLLEREGGTDVSGVNLGGFIRIHAGGRPDRRIGQELRRYFQENAWYRPWLERVKAIVVEDGVIGVVTDLRRDRRGRRVAGLLCTMVSDSGVAPDVGGHAVYGRNDERLRGW